MTFVVQLKPNSFYISWCICSLDLSELISYLQKFNVWSANYIFLISGLNWHYSLCFLYSYLELNGKISQFWYLHFQKVISNSISNL